MPLERLEREEVQLWLTDASLGYLKLLHYFFVCAILVYK